MPSLANKIFIAGLSPVAVANISAATLVSAATAAAPATAKPTTASFGSLVSAVTLNPAASVLVADLPKVGAVSPGSAFKDRLLVGASFAKFFHVMILPRPRAKFDIPISPVDKFDENTLFEAPLDASKKFYIPTFNLAEQVIDGQRRFRIAMDKTAEGVTLTVFFSPGVRVENAEPLPHSLSVVLRFVPPSAISVAKELPFVVENIDPGTWKATLAMADTNVSDQVQMAIKDSNFNTTFILRCSVNVAVPLQKSQPQDEQLYNAVTRNVDVRLNRDPFLFDPQQHPYIFQNVANVANKSFGFILRQVNWQGRNHLYYQDEASPYLFYYLPDEFKVTRRPTPPFTPNMLVKFFSEDGSREKMRASLEYVAAPVVDSERLEAARQALKPHLPSPMPAGVTDAVFQPLVVTSLEQLQLALNLPRAGASGSEKKPRPGAVTSLTSSIEDVISDMTLANFQDIYDAMFGKSAVIFSGEVLVGGGGQQPLGSVPFSARLDDLFGQVLEEIETPEADGSIRVTLRNSTESPLTLQTMPVEIFTGDRMVPAHTEALTKDGAPTNLPTRLAPSEELSMRVVADQPFTAQGIPDAIYDLDDILFEPDVDAVYHAILDTSVPAEYSRSIKVMAFEDMFEPTTDVKAIALDFENGESLVLRANNLEAEAKVRVPLSEFILRKVQESEYRYTMLVVRKTGQTRIQKTDTLDLIFPDVNV